MCCAGHEPDWAPAALPAQHGLLEMRKARGRSPATGCHPASHKSMPKMDAGNGESLRLEDCYARLVSGVRDLCQCCCVPSLICSACPPGLLMLRFGFITLRSTRPVVHGAIVRGRRRPGFAGTLHDELAVGKSPGAHHLDRFCRETQDPVLKFRNIKTECLVEGISSRLIGCSSSAGRKLPAAKCCEARAGRTRDASSLLPIGLAGRQTMAILLASKQRGDAVQSSMKCRCGAHSLAQGSSCAVIENDRHRALREIDAAHRELFFATGRALAANALPFAPQAHGGDPLAGPKPRARAAGSAMSLLTADRWSGQLLVLIRRIHEISAGAPQGLGGAALSWNETKRPPTTGQLSFRICNSPTG